MSTATVTSSSVAALDQALNEAILSGKALEAFEKYYAEDVVMQENSDEPRLGKEANRKAEIEFFSSLAEFHEGKLLSSAVNGDVTFGEWFMDVTFKNGYRLKLAQAAVRRWKDGQIVNERFYYHK
jgi:ketosteroid isomerase-like protein